MTHGSRRGLILSLVCVGALLLFMFWSEGHLSEFYKRLLYAWSINIILAVSFTLIYGHAGQFSLAHAGLMSVGAYVVGLLTLTAEQKAAMFILRPPIWPISVIHWPFVPAILAAGLLTALVGFLIGAPALRLRGDYFCMATLGFSELIRLALANIPDITNGSMGLRGIPRQANLVVAWLLACLTVAVVKRVSESSYGRAFKTIREDEIAAEAVGVSLFKHKVLAFVVSSFFVGIGGALQAQLLGTIDPGAYRTAVTYGVITVAVLGGLGSITGSVIAAGIYTFVAEALRAIETPRRILGIFVPGVPGMRVLLFSIVLLLLILFYRRGLMGSNEFSWEGLLRGIKSRLGKGREGARS